ncbi:hypothetical protein [Nostoc sp. PA-18-2419]|uniref:hypothetical protein n=1 Tax=Nostoc sp. PA-18-2419 TaxID=2575443 RepID=UPI0029500437|nr:hypothetical protein [Nostoc sp. PA-18-2419]
MSNSFIDLGITASVVEETDKFLKEGFRFADDTGGAWGMGIEAFCAVDSKSTERRRLPNERIESRENQVPLLETADLRAITINFFRWQTL